MVAGELGGVAASAVEGFYHRLHGRALSRGEVVYDDFRVIWGWRIASPFEKPSICDFEDTAELRHFGRVRNSFVALP